MAKEKLKPILLQNLNKKLHTALVYQQTIAGSRKK